MLELLLEAMTTYGPLVLGLAMLPGVAGVPVPVGVLLIAAGAFVRQGSMSWQTTFVLAWLGAVLSDVLSYCMGRWTARRVRGRLNERYAAVWQRAEELFRRHGGWAVFLTSWLVRSLAIPTNLISGSSGYSLWRFVAWDAVGKILWILLHAGLGYLFASQWQFVAQSLGRYGGWLGLGTAVVAGLTFVLRRLRARRTAAAFEGPAESASTAVGRRQQACRP